MPHVDDPVHRQPRSRGDGSARCCKTLAEIIVRAARRRRRAVFPIGGTRVLAYPTPHFAVADGSAGSRLRLPQRAHRRRPRARARSSAAGEALIAAVRAHFARDLRAAGRSASPCRSTKAAGVRRQAQQPASAVRRHAERMLADATIAALAAELHDAAEARASSCATSRSAIRA